MRTQILLLSAHEYMHNCLAIAIRPQFVHLGVRSVHLGVRIAVYLNRNAYYA